MAFAPNGDLTVKQAADKLGVSPWDVLALVRDGDLKGVTLVDAESLTDYKEGKAS